jgi:hypothetical protein
MEMHFQRMSWGKFGMDEKAAAALALLDEWGKDASAVPDQAKTNARALIHAINEHFERTR